MDCSDPLFRNRVGKRKSKVKIQRKEGTVMKGNENLWEYQDKEGGNKFVSK